MSTRTGGPSASLDPRVNAFARLFEGVREGIYVGLLSTQPQNSDATVVVNRHLRQMFGCPQGRPDSELHPLASSHFVDQGQRTQLIDQLRSTGSVIDVTVRLRRFDGRELVAEISAHATSHSDQFIGVEVLLRDVSEHNSLAARQRELQQQESAHAERLASLDYALSSVAHELNNPLMSIIAWAERISEAPFSETTRRDAPMLLREAQRAARIVRNLLTLSRKRPSTRTLIDANQLIRETLALRAHDQRKLQINVTAALTPVLPRVFVDGHQIQQVLLNLVINAEQAMTSANGRGSLMVRSFHDEDRHRVIIEVIDDGPGVPAPVKERIFDPFFTTKAAGEGTGLGLTVAHAIIREHGGNVRLNTRPSGGATFTVELPVADATGHQERIN